MDSSRRWPRSEFPPGTFQGCRTKKSNWKRLIVCKRDVAWIVGGVPPGHGAAAPRVEAGPDPSVNVADLGGADALTTAPVKGAGAATTPTTSVDVGKHPANVVITTRATVAPGMSVAQEPWRRQVVAEHELLSLRIEGKSARDPAARRAAGAVTQETTRTRLRADPVRGPWLTSQAPLLGTLT